MIHLVCSQYIAIQLFSLIMTSPLIPSQWYRPYIFLQLFYGCLKVKDLVIHFYRQLNGDIMIQA